MMTTKSLKSFLINVAIVGIALVISLFLGELLVRVAAPQKLYRFPQHLFSNHPELEYVLTPGFSGRSDTTEYDVAIRTNGIGIREDRELSADLQDGHRVLMIGDSFTMGVGVESQDSLPQQLERILQLSSAAPIQVINSGVPGYGTKHSIAHLREYGFDLNPDLIVLGFFIGNDLADNQDSTRHVVVNGYLRSARSQQGLLPIAIRDFIQIRSHLYQLLWPLQRQIRDSNFREELKNAQLSAFMKYAAVPDESAQLTWNVSQEYLVELIRLTQLRDIPLVILLIPEMIQTLPSRWEEVAAGLAAPRFTFRRDYPNERLEEFATNHSVPAVNLLEPLTHPGRSTPYYYELDGHWTIEGTAVVAKTIADFLIENGLLVSQGQTLPESRSD